MPNSFVKASFQNYLAFNGRAIFLVYQMTAESNNNCL